MDNDISATNSVEQHSRKGRADEDRRNFLRKSLYIAYTTPVVVSMLVEKASAATSWGDKAGPTEPPPPPPTP